MPRKQLNQRQISERLGISPATVSLVLSNPDTTRASEQTKKRIYELVTAHAPRVAEPAPKADTILLVMEGNHGAFFQLSMLHGAQRRVAELGLKLEIINPSQDLQRFVVARYVKGVLIQPHELPPGQALILEKYFRTITLNALRQEAFTSMAIQHDDFGGFKQALQHLVEHGHRRVAFLNEGYERQPSTTSVSYGRETAFREACDFIGRDIVTADILRLTPGDPMSLRDILTQWRKTDDHPTAMCCYNDLLATQACNVAANLGIRIPEDLSLIGFDNDSLCDTLLPRLTSIYPGWSEIGELGVDLIMDDTFWSAGYAPYKVTVPSRLVVRDSVTHASTP